YLKRIFLANMEIEGGEAGEDAKERAQSLAERRAPALIDEYEDIGGSPMNQHANRQADLLQSALSERGFDVKTYTAFQFTEPFIEDVARTAKGDGVKKLIGLPIYPLCGPSTTIQSLEKLRGAVEELTWQPDYDEITGWHTYPPYLRLRSKAIRNLVDQRGLSFDKETKLIFSAHGTPVHYLNEGSRYDQYVREYATIVNQMLGDPGYELGFQNHENRDVDWTEPEIEAVVQNVDADRIIVDPMSFMHEQSETLSELDLELREIAEGEGMEFFRVPIPYDDDSFIELLGDLVEPFIADFDPDLYGYQSCSCCDSDDAMCLNARRHKH
ncbi:MAG: ferrochelatase, partial [Halobacteriaceae archaeon]